jgi:hypothetical protein
VELALLVDCSLVDFDLLLMESFGGLLIFCPAPFANDRVLL